MTAGGIKRLLAELRQLMEQEGPALNALRLDDSETRRLRQVLNRRIAYLQESLRTAEEMGEPAHVDRVAFGATVKVRDSLMNESTYCLVGVDEADPRLNRVSWTAPIARALWHARVGQRVPFKFPTGQTELEIMGIAYSPQG
jgi:transcription elongation factor GreB